MLYSDIEYRALRMTGIYSGSEDIDSYDSIDCVNQMNGILESWNSDPMKSYAIKESEFALMQGKSKYSIGPTGDFVANRPLEILYATTVDNYNLTHDLEVIRYDQFESIPLKNTGNSYPTVMYFNPTAPNGEISLYPVPQANLTLRLKYWESFPTQAVGVVELPSGYSELLTYQLAVDMCSYFGRTPPVQVERKLKSLEYKQNELSATALTATVQVDTPNALGAQAIYKRNYIPRSY